MKKYMGLALWHASFSKDPTTQVGAVIVDSKRNKIIGTGYNGPPPEYNDQEVDWSRPEKYDDMVHAEDNAIEHRTRDIPETSVIYVTALPCNKSMFRIVNAGIKKVIYLTSKYYDPKSSLNDKETLEATMRIARKGKIEVKGFNGNLNWMRDRIKWMEQAGVFE
jgi:dCMP deaminase